MKAAGGRGTVSFSLLGVATVASSLFLGNSYTVSAIALCISLVAVFAARRHPVPLIFLASILAAAPVNSSAALPCNMILACTFLVFNLRFLADLPKWLYLEAALVVSGFTLSSLNWLEHYMSLVRQVNHFANFLLMPVLLLPLLYSRIQAEQEMAARLRALLLFLILPTTLLLLAAYIFGTPIGNFRSEEVYDAMDIRMFRFINTDVNFTRTHSGFIFASLVCASAAVVMVPVQFLHRSLAAVCLAVNAILLLTVGSVGSTLAALSGLAAVFLGGALGGKLLRLTVSLLVIASLAASVWLFAPAKVREYAHTRYEERFVSKGINVVDRTALWKRAFDYSLRHPEGVGWSISYSDQGRKMNPHNDYLLFAINYGVLAGLAYLYLLLRLCAGFLSGGRKRIGDPAARAVTLAGLGVATVLLVNSLSDHLVANKWYFNVVWSLLWYCHFARGPMPQEAGGEVVPARAGLAPPRLRPFP